jgi:hypothetical protein
MRALIDTHSQVYIDAVFKEMLDSSKDAFTAAEQAVKTAVAAASTNLLATFQTLKQQQQHGSTVCRHAYNCWGHFIYSQYT